MKNFNQFLSKLCSARLFVIVLAIIMSTTAQAASTISQGDSLALVDFYKKTNGANWYNQNGWLTGSASTWQGIVLVNKRVVELSLTSNNLTGTLPYSLPILTELKTLNLSYNAIGGTLPITINLLLKLESLELSNNAFTGSIPKTTCLLNKLKYLSLSSNSLTGKIPAEIGNLKALTYLDLSVNQLSGTIPTEIGKLTNLFRLFLSNNQFSGSIPQSIGNLVNATRIYLDHNNLSGTIPSTIGNLKSIIYLYLSDNKLSGALPSSIVNLPAIYTLNVSNNKITELPNLTEVASLIVLNVENNRLTFSDIEPNISKFASGSYAPQDSIGTNATVHVCEGQDLVLIADFDGNLPNSSYTWFNSDFSFISDPQTTSTLTIPNADFSNVGVYSAEISNPAVPNLLLYRRTVVVTVDSCVSSLSKLTSVYPVPFEDQVTVKVSTSKSEPLTIAVYDKLGNVIYKNLDLKTNQEYVLPGSLFLSGYYYLKATYKDKTETTRIVKK